MYPLPEASLSELGFAAKPLAPLDAMIKAHIDEGRYAGAQIALARHGKLALFRSYGNARDGQPAIAVQQHRAIQIPAVRINRDRISTIQAADEIRNRVGCVNESAIHVIAGIEEHKDICAGCVRAQIDGVRIHRSVPLAGYIGIPT